ncbi:MAG: hypothetical protein KDH09_01355 [Chrysiogenetes bacterium]|nr:hypothetical protein [Chrysiogenetes bacterium]
MKQSFNSVPGRRARPLLAFLALLALAACKSGPPPSIEEVITARIGEVETAAREHQLKEIKAVVSDRYADDKRNSKKEINQLLTYYFFRNKAIYPFVRVQSVVSENPERASAELLVALTGTPVAQAEDLSGLNADLFHFVLEFSLEDDEWMVTGATWRRAELGDFL